MDVRIATRHLELSEAFRGHARERASRLSKYAPRLLSVELLFEGDHGTVKTEARADVPGRSLLVARGESTDRRASLDQALNRLGRQLRRYRSKRVDHQAEPASIPVND